MQAASPKMHGVSGSKQLPRAGRSALGGLLGLSLLASSAGCGEADPRDPLLDERQEATCLPQCKPSPATLISGVKPTSIALSDTNAYFTNAFSLFNELDRVPIAGGSKTILATNPETMTSVVRVGNSLFWANISGDSAGGVWRISTSGGGIAQVSHHQDDLISGQALAAYTTGSTIFLETHVLFAEAAIAKLFDTQLSFFGNSEVSLLPAKDPVTNKNYYPFSLVLDSTNVYFTHDTGEELFRAPLVGGVPFKLVDSAERTALAIDGSNLFFQQGGDIKEIAVSGGPISTFATAVGMVSAMVARSGVVYWACGTCGTVVKKSVNGATSTVLASSQDNPRSLALDDSYVYFGTNTALKRIAK